MRLIARLAANRHPQVDSRQKSKNAWRAVKDKYTDVCLECPYTSCKSGQCDLTGNKKRAEACANIYCRHDGVNKNRGGKG